MFRATKIADSHIHASQPDIDKNIAMLDELYEMGVKDIAIVSAMEHSIDENLKALYLKETFKKSRVAVLGGLYYDKYFNQYTSSFLEQAETLLAMGCDGMKFLEGKPNYRKQIGFGLNATVYDEMFYMLEEKNIPIVWHACDPDELWDREALMKWPGIAEDFIKYGWLYDDPSFLSFEAILNEVLERLEKNPGLNVVFAHFLYMSKRLDFAEELFSKYPNIKLDITPGWPMFIDFVDDFDEWRAFFERHSDRILFGTDIHTSPVYKATHETARLAIAGETDLVPIPMVPFANMRGFDLSKNAQENIFYNNFDSFIGTPKPVNKTLLVSEAEKMASILKLNNACQDGVERLNRICKELS